MERQVPQAPPISIDKTFPVPCPDCGNEVFVNGQWIRRIPRVLSPDGRPGIIIVAAMICSKCGKAWELPTLEQKASQEK